MKKSRRPLSTAKKIERAIKKFPIALCLCAVLWAGFAATKKLVKPVFLYCREAREVSQIQKELQQVRRENARLSKQMEYIRDREGAQTEARKLGYVRPGEISIMIQREKTQ